MAAASYSFVTDTVFVRGIPSDTTDEQLLERFADVGPVKHAYCLRDKLTHRAKYGFVKFAIREDAQVAVDTLSGALLNGKKMMVENAVERGAEGVDKSAIAQAKTQRRNERATARQQERESKLRTVVLWAPRGSNSQQDDGSGSDSDSGSDSSSSSSSSSSSEDEVEDEDEDMANGEDNVSATDSNISATNDKGLGAVRALLKKHSLNSAVIADVSKKYGARAFLATFPTPDISRNAYRRLKKVAAAFFPKREFNLSHSAKASASCRLIIRNLAWKVSEADIETVFSPFGPLESVHLPRDQKNRKGFALCSTGAGTTLCVQFVEAMDC